MTPADEGSAATRLNAYGKRLDAETDLLSPPEVSALWKLVQHLEEHHGCHFLTEVDSSFEDDLDPVVLKALEILEAEGMPRSKTISIPGSDPNKSAYVVTVSPAAVNRIACNCKRFEFKPYRACKHGLAALLELLTDPPEEETAEQVFSGWGEGHPEGSYNDPKPSPAAAGHRGPKPSPAEVAETHGGYRARAATAAADVLEELEPGAEASVFAFTAADLDAPTPRNHWDLLPAATRHALVDHVWVKLGALGVKPEGLSREAGKLAEHVANVAIEADFATALERFRKDLRVELDADAEKHAHDAAVASETVGELPEPVDFVRHPDADDRAPMGPDPRDV